MAWNLRGEKDSNVGTTDSASRETRFIDYLIAAPAAVVLSLGTLWSVRWLILDLARRVILAGMLF